MIQNRIVPFLLLVCSLWVLLFGCFDWEKLPAKACVSDDVCGKLQGDFYCNGTQCVPGTRPTERVESSSERGQTEPTNDTLSSDEPKREQVSDGSPGEVGPEVLPEPEVPPKKRDPSANVPYPAGHPCLSGDRAAAALCTCAPTQLYHVLGQAHPSTITHSVYTTAPATGSPTMVEQRLLLTADDLGNIKLWKDAKLTSDTQAKHPLISTQPASNSAQLQDDPEAVQVAALLVSGAFTNQTTKRVLSVTKKGLLRIWRIDVQVSGEVSGLRFEKEIQIPNLASTTITSAAWAPAKNYVFLGRSNGEVYFIQYCAQGAPASCKNDIKLWRVGSNAVTGVVIHPLYEKTESAFLVTSSDNVKLWSLKEVFQKTGTQKPALKAEVALGSRTKVTHLGIATQFVEPLKPEKPLPLVLAAKSDDWEIYSLKVGQAPSLTLSNKSIQGVGSGQAIHSLSFAAPPLGITPTGVSHVVLLGSGDGVDARVEAIKISESSQPTFFKAESTLYDPKVLFKDGFPTGVVPRALFAEPPIGKNQDILVGLCVGAEIRAIKAAIGKSDPKTTEYFVESRRNHSVGEKSAPTALTTVAISPDRKWVVSGGNTGSVLVWDATVPQFAKYWVVFSLLDKELVRASWLGFNADGTTLAIITGDLRLRLISIKPGMTIADFPPDLNKVSAVEVLKGATIGVSSAVWHPTNPSILAVASGDGRVQLLQKTSSGLLKPGPVLVLSDKAISALSFDRLGHMAVGQSSGTTGGANADIVFFEWDKANLSLTRLFSWKPFDALKTRTLALFWPKLWVDDVVHLVHNTDNRERCPSGEACRAGVVPFLPDKMQVGSPLSLSVPSDHETFAQKFLVHPERAWLASLDVGMPDPDVSVATGAKVIFWRQTEAGFQAGIPLSPSQGTSIEQLLIPGNLRRQYAVDMSWAPGLLAISTAPLQKALLDKHSWMSRTGKVMLWRCPPSFP